MKACYDKLLKILIDRKMTKTDLRQQAKISSSTLAKIGKQEMVSSDVLVKICDTLQCDISDIVELVKDENEEFVVQNDPNKLKVVSMFSGAGGMDIGFEGGFRCLKRSINISQNPDWISEDQGMWVMTAPTKFDTVFANDIRPDAKAAWVSYFGNRCVFYHI